MKTKPSWKDKIDPAFDRLIKNYLGFIDAINLPANTGWVIFEPEYLSHWEKKGMESWSDRYDKHIKKVSERIIKLKTQKGMPLKEKKRKRVAFQKKLFAKIEKLPWQSQEYYKKAFEMYYEDKYIDYDFKSMPIEELKERVNAFFMDQLLLSLHIDIVEAENREKNETAEDLKKKLRRSPLVMDMMLSAYNSLSVISFGKNMYQLIKEVKDDNADSLFQILQIDRSMLEWGPAQRMIRKAQLSGDMEFFRKVAEAITTPPVDNTKVHVRAALVLLMFWELGLKKLSNDERYELLKSCGIRVQDEPESFRRFANRLMEDAGKMNQSLVAQ